MERRLKWNAMGFEAKAKQLLEALREIQGQTDPAHAKKMKTVKGLFVEMQHVCSAIDRVKGYVIPKLEERFRLKFKTPELIYLALARPMLRTTFNNLAMFFKSRGDGPLKDSDYEDLADSGDTAQVLALIGDCAVKLAIIETFWDSTKSNVGQLTQTKASIESNKNMARLCDEIHLYENMIDRVQQPSNTNIKEQTIIHEKGTLVEAIFGVVYLEFGFEELCRLVPLLQ